MGDKSWSQRAAEIESFKVMDLLKRARQLESEGYDVVHMEVGEPDFGTPAPVAEAAKVAIDKGLTQYTPAAGIPELRQRIAEFYKQRYGVDLPAERILVTAGASGALLLAFSLLTDAGQKMILSDPGYPCNRQFLRVLEAASTLVPVDASGNYQLTAESVAAHWDQDTAGVLLASPANPTGTVVADEELAAIADVVANRGGQLVVDELYHGLTYGFDATSVLQIQPDAFVLNSFSKYFGMTGWRLGWLVAPEGAVHELERMAQNLFISPPTVSQYAALAAFEPDTIAILEQRREAFRQRRDLLVAGLRDIGFELPVTPQGAFYVYADASRFTDNTFDFCWDILEDCKVAVTPGLDFGHHHASRHIRFSYTTDLDRIELALERIRQKVVG